MNEVQLFNFENHEVRSLLLNNEPWFVGKDVADVLGYQNGSRDINRHVDEEDRQNYQNGTFKGVKRCDFKSQLFFAGIALQILTCFD